MNRNGHPDLTHGTPMPLTEEQMRRAKKSPEAAMEVALEMEAARRQEATRSHETTNYNDGKWHGWNGGECPVHRKTVVDIRWEKDSDGSQSEAGIFTDACWEHNSPIGNRIIAFRVIKEHREPREFWVVTYDGTAWDYEDQAKKRAASCQSPIIHVREVLE